MAEILHTRIQHTWLISCVKKLLYDLKLSHNTSVTDGRTHDNHANSSIVRLLKYSRL